MATVQRLADKDEGSAWGYWAGAASARLSAYLSGQYVFRFSNASARTAKLHLADDRPGAAYQQDYFLTIPVGVAGVEVPMTSEMIVVSAGFYRPEDGAYEVFWERRRFSWAADINICIDRRHSVDANRIHEDVWPGAPEVRAVEALAAQPAKWPSLFDGYGGDANISVGRETPSTALSPNSTLPYCPTQGDSWTYFASLPDSVGEVEEERRSAASSARLPREPVLLALPPATLDRPRHRSGASSSSWASCACAGADTFASDFEAPPTHLQHPEDQLDGAAAASCSGCTFSTSAASPAASRVVGGGPRASRGFR